jgi:dCMP deaminase
MKEKHIKAHMQVAEVYAQLSTANRLKVGAIVVKDNRVISIGYNGTPAGWDNTCEEMVVHSHGFDSRTKPEVIHAEANAISKLARTHDSGDSATMFITHSPCIECAKLIYNAGIKNVFYKEPYRNNDGVDFLKKCGIEVTEYAKAVSV